MANTCAGGLRARDMTRIALCAVSIAVCSWIAIPSAVPFTMQTFGVFCALALLGGRRGSIAVAVYVLLGAVGLPVFAGFSGGVAKLMGSTGGYIIGMLFMGPTYWLATRLFGERIWSEIAGMALGLIICYAFGTAWFMAVYARSSGPIGIAAALGWCVTPFILPDAGKLALALFLARRIRARI